MTKGQRSFWTALLGLIAAVATAIAGGWAIYVALSHQSEEYGNINLIWHKEQGDIPISTTLLEYETSLKRRERGATERLKQAHAGEYLILKKEKAEIKRRLADIQASYQSHVEELKERIAHIECIRGQAPDALLDQARDALAQGDQDQADKLFARIETKDKATIEAAAEAAYQRSRIALDEIRYRAANEEYSAAKNHYEQALVSDVETYGQDHPRIAIRHDNVGSAWQDLGEYGRAIGYFEQLLASNL